MIDKQTATKAHAAGLAGALTPVLLWLLSRYTGAVEAPPDALVRDSLAVLISAAGTGAAAWLATWFAPRNRAK